MADQNTAPVDLPGIIQIAPPVHADQRGYFFEAWKQSSYQALGLPEQFVQVNVSRSKQGVLRGLHYQHPGAQGKLVGVLDGRIFDVAVDIRPGSPTFGRWQGFELDSEAHAQVYIPEGFAHGFQVLSGEALIV